MRIGVLKEIKNSENRVAVIPATVAELIRHGHEVHIEHDAGLGSGFKDEDYSQTGAIIEADAESVWKTAELLYKVKEILPQEYKYLREDLIVMTYIHSNAHRDETEALMAAKCPSIALEDISSDRPGHKWPLLANMRDRKSVV